MLAGSVITAIRWERLAQGGSAWRRAPYEPLLVEAALVDPCFEYRFADPGESAQDYGRRAANSLEQEILRTGPDNVIAFVAETVVGATSGAVPPAGDYLQQVRAICDRHGVLLILDEVMSGSGRTGTFLACEQDGIVPDIVTLGKGLGGGYQPIGAVVCTSKVYETIAEGSGALKHGQTYNAHAVGCAAGLAVQRIIQSEKLLERVTKAGATLMKLLNERFCAHPNIGDIRGRGLFQAMELVADRETKAPFDPELTVHQRGKSGSVRARPTDLSRRRHNRWPQWAITSCSAPPYNVTDDELEMIVDLLDETIGAVLPS